MITLFHTADVHLGVKYLMLGEKAQVQREALKETFRKIVDEVIAVGGKFAAVTGFFDAAERGAGVGFDRRLIRFEPRFRVDYPVCKSPVWALGGEAHSRGYLSRDARRAFSWGDIYPSGF